MAMCESCGADDERLISVHRRYLTPADWDTEGSDRLLPEVEQWCFACATTYPNQVAEGADD